MVFQVVREIIGLTMDRIPMRALIIELVQYDGDCARMLRTRSTPVTYVFDRRDGKPCLLLSFAWQR